MLLLVNADDLSGEALPHVIEGLLARGAESAHVLPTITKKGRQGYMFFVDAPDTRLDQLGSFLVSELGTIGMRVLETRHIRFEYRFKQVRLVCRVAEEPLQALVRVKEIVDGQGHVVAIKAEHEDLRAALSLFELTVPRISLPNLKRLAEQTVQGRHECANGSILSQYLGDD